MKTASAKYLFPILALLFFMAIAGCYRGRKSSNPPIHLNPNMDKQPKYKAQEASGFFANHSNMRLPVEGTVARGELNDDIEYYTGKNEKGKFIRDFPVKVDMTLLRRGQERFNIFCSPCHGRTAEGNGIVVQRGLIPPTSFHDQRIRDLDVGEIFYTMSTGLRNMPSYKNQVLVPDRWAIIAYIRALQKSRNATINDIPQDILEKLNQ